MTDRELVARLRACVRRTRGRLSCRRAHLLAVRLGVRLGRLGRLCQAHGIKICDCQLGCFGPRRHD